MAFIVRKNAIQDLIKEYIKDRDKPIQQIEHRIDVFFDMNSIIDEIYLNLKNINGIKCFEDLRRIIRLIMHMAEENANKYKRFKVISEDVAYACSKVDEIVKEHA